MLHKSTISVNSLLDKLGMVSALICAVHCLLVPAIMLTGVSHFMAVDHWMVDTLFLVLAFIFIYLSIFRSFKIHQNPKAIKLAMMGLSCFLVGVICKGDLIHYLFGLGGLIIVFAHYTNHKILQSYKS